MNREDPLVSVIVRTKDRPVLLKKALQSIAAQTYRRVEVILVNDGGCVLDTVSLAALLGDIPLRYERLEKNTGRAHAGNTGIERASGKYIGFLDDDDEFYDDHISVLVNILENYDFKVAYSDANISYRYFDPEGKDMTAGTMRLFSSKDFSFQELLIDNYIPLICLLFSREVLDEFRGFDEGFDIYEDWDLLIRIAGRYPFSHAAKPTAEYIQWSSTLQVSQTPEFADLADAAHFRIIKKHREKFSEEIIRDLVHNKRTLRDKDQHISELERRVQEQRGYAAGLEKSLRENEDLISGLDRAIQEKEAGIAHLEKIIAEKEGYAASFENLVRKHEEHLAGLQKTMGEMHNHIVRLENTIQERDTHITRLGDVIREKEMRIESLESAIEEQKGRLVHLEMDIAARDERISGLEKTIGEKDNFITGLDNVMAEKDVHLAHTANEVLNRDLRIDGLERLVQEKDGYVTRLESMNANLEQEIKEKDAALKSIYGSRGWKGLVFYYKVRDTLLPPHSFRSELVKSSVKRIIRLIEPKTYPHPEGIQKGGQDSLVPPVKEKIKTILPLAAEEIVPHPDSVNEIKDMSADETASYRNKDTVTPAEKPECGKKENGDTKKCTVLVAGVYLADQKNAIGHIVHELNQSASYEVVQKWIALSGDAPSHEVQAVTVMKAGNPQPKFVLLNKLLSLKDLEQYDYVLICDDDILLPENFLDNFLGLQQKYDFSLAQPARTHNSYTDHPIVEQFEGLKARRTRFVEIGPVLSIRRDAYPVLLPFDETAHMGWGYDFVWPYLIGKSGLRMGIIDATPLDHSMRKPVQNYNYDEANSAMQKYLSRTPHLSREEAFTILESYT